MARRKKRNTAKSSSIIPAWIWLTLGILIGLGIAMFTRTNGRHVAEQTATPSESAITTEPTTKRKFDFYTLLPELEIVIPQEETRPPKISSSSQYELTTYQLKGAVRAEVFGYKPYAISLPKQQLLKRGND